MTIISACLIGINCAYHGKSNLIESLLHDLEPGELIPICPEQLGGLTTPRDRARLVGGDGWAFWKEMADVVTVHGENVSQQYRRGGLEALKIAKLFSVGRAILKANSPSCGCGGIFNETVSDVVPGDGTTTALFKANGIEVVSEEQYQRSRSFE